MRNRKKLFAVTATMLSAATLYSAGLAGQGNGQGGNNAASAGVIPSQSAIGGGSSAVGPAGVLGVVAPGGGPLPGSNLYKLTTNPVTTTLQGAITPHISGMARQPGTRNYLLSGGMTDGGNIYGLAGSGAVGIGPSGFSAVPGMTWNPAGTTLYGTVTVAILADGLITINPLTGAGTLVGPMGGGIGGIDSLGWDPVTNTMFGSTGFFFDGSPGDEIVINPATGAASKTGVMSPTPTCTVAGMSFTTSGVGYISIGCGPGAGGNVYSWNPTTNAITLITNVTGSAASASSIEVVR
jgi:hypothetical protein